MKGSKIIVVRIYLTESEKTTRKIIDYLKNTAKIQGITLFRAIWGYGETGTHTASLIDLSLDLPITIEFFDHEEKINPAVKYLTESLKLDHVISWEASSHHNMAC